MGASASVVDQGSPTSAHDRDISSSDSKGQHDWSQAQPAEAKQEGHSLQEKLESYNKASVIIGGMHGNSMPPIIVALHNWVF